MCPAASINQLAKWPYCNSLKTSFTYIFLLAMPVPFPAPTFYLNSSRSFYVVHHSGFLDSFLNTPEHPLRDCNFDRFTHRSATMAETTSLLPQAFVANHNPNLFLRACHSSWPILRQKRLLAIRAITALYLTMALALSILYECSYAKQRAALFPFYASTVSLFIQVCYHWIATVRLSKPSSQISSRFVPS